MTMRRLVQWAVLGARIGLCGLAVVRIARAGRIVAPVVPMTTSRHRISVVIPARNEEARLTAAVRSALADPAVYEVIVVDDESTDETAALACSLGAVVVNGAPRPLGWAGKCWAVQQGCEAAVGDWVVTLDADTEPAVGLAAGLVDRAERDGFDFLTASAQFRCHGPALAALHPSMLTSLVYRFGPVGARRSSRPSRALANGQCMVVNRAKFLEAGGMGVVAGSLVEDVALARHLSASGWSVGFVDASNLLAVTMHESAGDAWASWGRSLPLPGLQRPVSQAADLATVLVAQALPIPRLLLGVGDPLDVAMALVRLGTLIGTRRAYEQPRWSYWFSPVFDLGVAARLVQATVRPERTWRGRTYGVTELGSTKL